MKRKLSEQRAFTLIELLVVISIIAMLMAILMPSLNRAKGAARKVVCMANVRRLSAAMQFYVTEHQDYFPPDRYRQAHQGIKVGKYIRYRPRWIWFLDHGVGPVINPDKYDTEAEFNAALEMDNDYFLCPSFKDKEYVRSIRNGAYGFNYQYISNTRPDPTGKRYSNFPNKMTRIRRPMETILIGDSRGAGIPHGQHAYTMDPPKMAYSKNARNFGPKSKKIVPIGGAKKYSPADTRHLGKANMAFADGHAEAMNYEQMGYEIDPETNRPYEKANKEIGGPGNNRLWSGNGRDEPDVK
jgi:prepilin-type N-terminal cleavage/methylation domain-containing protein/prepilin-type processing-associated H-X9-DG protein